MDHSIAIPALVAFFITLILGPGLISFLHKLKFGQFIREEGPENGRITSVPNPEWFTI